MKKNSKKNIIVFLISLGIAFYYINFGKPAVVPTSRARVLSSSVATSSAMVFPVTRVVDGDTIKIIKDEKEETVRFLGVDTPELVDPRKPVQCFAEEASELTKKLLNGMSIYLEIDPTQGERDAYGRLLAYVLLPDGINVSDYLIRNGYAYEYTYENNAHRYQAVFRQAQKEARENKQGLWAEGACL